MSKLRKYSICLAEILRSIGSVLGGRDFFFCLDRALVGRVEWKIIVVTRFGSFSSEIG